MSGPTYNVSVFNSRRSPVFARKGMVASAQPLASIAGLRMLMEGGNAIDAAVAAAATLAVTEPYQTGLGGDAFAIVHHSASGKTEALNASGAAPLAARIEDYASRGWTTPPQNHPYSWTTPGCVDGLSKLLERYGTMSLARTLSPAIAYADDGFPVSPADATSWVAQEAMLRADKGCSQCFLTGGHAPRTGDVFRQPALARTLRAIAEGGSEAFYKGSIAADIVKFSESMGGLFTLQDFAGFSAEWTTPIAYAYRGHEILQCPPNGQGVAALLALRNFAANPISGDDRMSANCLHRMIEATKHGMVEAARCVADPKFASFDVAALLGEPPPLPRERAQDPSFAASNPCDTVFIATADGEGNAVALITSIYSDFGSGFCVPEHGFILQDRGSGFSLDPNHPNCVAPGKRPYHTIIPGMALKNGSPALIFGITGGFLQPQGHLQLLVSLLDYGLDVQSAIDMPRFWWEAGNRVVLEDGFPGETYDGLIARGHEVLRRNGHRGFGGAQIIQLRNDPMLLIGGSEPRHDGVAIGW